MLFFVLLSGMVLLFYLYRKRQVNLLKNLGIPGPEPHWLFGNLRSITNEQPLLLCIEKWTQKYGEIWGYYEGPKPTVVISNPDAVRDILIKQFSSFHSRKPFALAEDPDKGKNVSMFIAHGDRWKRLRTIANPAFTERKLRKMFALVKKSVDTLMKNFDEADVKVPIDVYDHYKRLTLDIIGECAFGIDISSLADDQNPLLVKLKALFNIIGRRHSLVVIAETFPEIIPLVRGVAKILSRLIASRGSGLFLRNRLIEIIGLRRKDPSLARTDILQLLLDAEVDDVKTSVDATEKRKKALSKEEVVSQSLLFLFAGYETSSTTLAFISYNLATNPEAQRKLQMEIDALCEEVDESQLNEGPDHLSKLKYMDCVINESLRMKGVGNLVVGRQCSQSTTVCGYTIPAGVNVLIDVQSVHDNPDVWGPTDTSIFNPDRFIDENRHPVAFLGFGGGPRICIGQRFAYMVIRYTLFRMLRKYNLKTCSETEIPIRLLYGATVTPEGAVTLLLEPRNLSD